MTKALGLFGALLIALAIPTAGALAAPKFPPLTGRVVDNANVLSPQAEQDLDGKLEALETSTGRQLVVATLPDLQGYEIADYGYQLGRAWKIGQKGEDNGVLFLVAPSERKTRIEVGYGLEPILTDALSSVILQTQVLPKFKDGDIQGGVVDGTQAIIDQLALPEDQAKAKVAAAAQNESVVDSDNFGALIAMFIVFWVIASVIGGLGGRRRRSGNWWWLLPLLLSSNGRGGGSWGGGGGGGGGFSGGGGSFGGGGSSGSW